MSAKKIIIQCQTKKAAITMFYNKLSRSYHMAIIVDAPGFKTGTSCLVQVSQAFAKELASREHVDIKEVDGMGEYTLDLYCSKGNIE